MRATSAEMHAYKALRKAERKAAGLPNPSRALTQVKLIQRLLLRDIEDGGTHPRDRASLARSWDILEDRKRELAGKPRAGSRRPAAPKPEPKVTFGGPIER